MVKTFADCQNEALPCDKVNRVILKGRWRQGDWERKDRVLGPRELNSTVSEGAYITVFFQLFCPQNNWPIFILYQGNSHGTLFYVFLKFAKSFAILATLWVKKIICLQVPDEANYDF